MAKLKLTRNQLASFLPDHETVKQFETLFTVVDEINTTGYNDAVLAAGLADTKAQQALDSLERVSNENSLAALSPAIENNNSVFTDYIDFAQTAPHTNAPGRLAWNEIDGTLDLHLKGGNVTLQIGQEQVVRVVNKSGADLIDGQVVYLSGAQGNRVKVDLAVATGSTSLARTVLGLITEPIANNQEGFVTISGLVRGLNTSAFVDGDVLYLSTTPGQITNVRPSAPTHVVVVGFCVNANPAVGSILVSVQPGYDLEDLSDVAVTSPVNGNLLIYNATAQDWQNNLLTAGSGVSITNGPGTISISATGLGGTVTNVSALTIGTAGTDLSSSVANSTTTPVITLNVPTASATNRGALSSTDWTTFNNKGNGSVTSVSQTFTGGLISVSGSPITGSGTLALTVAGTSGGIPYFSSATTWASSAALAANALVVGGGAGAAPATITTGTGAVTALGVNVGTAGAFVVNGGALGTPSSGTVTNLTGTASININGTVGATTANTGAFTSLSYTTTLTGGTGIVNLGSGQFYKDASGNIGIGTTVPATKLDIRSGDITLSRTASGTAGDAALNFGNGSTAYIFSGNSSNVMAFAVNSLERMRIDSSGNVGIGVVPSGTYKLEVNGSLKTQGDYVLSSSTGSKIYLYYGTATNNNYITADSSGFMRFGTGTSAPTDRLSIDTSGNVLLVSTGGLGYGAGSGGAVTQLTSRATGVTLNKTNGAITMFSAAGSATAATFTVTNSTVVATDTVILSVKSSTNVYLMFVTAVAAGSFNITFQTTGGTATDAPVINFAVIKAVTA